MLLVAAMARFIQSNLYQTTDAYVLKKSMPGIWVKLFATRCALQSVRFPFELYLFAKVQCVIIVQTSEGELIFSYTFLSFMTFSSFSIGPDQISGHDMASEYELGNQKFSGSGSWVVIVSKAVELT
jgi:type III secretory pathway component EscS